MISIDNARLHLEASSMDQAEPKQQQVIQVAFLTHEACCLLEAAAARFLHTIQFLAGEEAVA